MWKLTIFLLLIWLIYSIIFKLIQHRQLKKLQDIYPKYEDLKYYFYFSSNKLKTSITRLGNKGRVVLTFNTLFFLIYNIILFFTINQLLDQLSTISNFSSSLWLLRICLIIFWCAIIINLSYNYVPKRKVGYFLASLLNFIIHFLNYLLIIIFLFDIFI